jgi:hypothetical protein
VGENWKSFEMQTREALECCKPNLMVDFGSSSEHQNVKRNEDIRDVTHEISDRNKDTVGNWTRGHS